jgi:hypothetical protein
VTSNIADIVLGLSIPLMIGVFFVMRPIPATLVVALGGEMFLPVGPEFRIPWVPPLGKHNLVYLCILVGCLLRNPGKVTKLPQERWFLVLSLLALVGGAMTGLTNGDALNFGAADEVVIPAMTFKDGMFVGISELFPSCLAFYLGYALFRGTKDVEKLLAGLGIAGLAYCPFAIIEMRMSPQFHKWVYGYGMDAFNETIRWGGYRPTLFMPHGLAVSRFFVATTLALFLLAKSRRSLFGLPVRLLAWFQAIVLVLCRSTGAIVLAFVGVAFILLTKPKRQLLLATVLAVAILAYPLLRASGIFPVSDLLDAAGALQEGRRDSLAFRFVNEDRLLARARERILFGWGTYGRGRVFDEAGRDISVTDGHWIIVLGMSGIAGFLVSFGVLLWPVAYARLRLRKHAYERSQRPLAGLALILALVTVDLIPNGLWSFYPYLLAGVLARGLREWTPMNDKGGQQLSEDNEAPVAF